MGAHEAAKVVMLDEGELGRDQRAEVVIHDRQVQALEVGDIAADVERLDLPLALSGDIVAAGEALDDEAALGGGVTFADDILIRRNGFQPQRQALEGSLLLWCERSDALQLADQRDSLWWMVSMTASQGDQAGARVSQPPASEA